MNELFVPYGIAKHLKQLKFDKPCFGYYDNGNYFNWSIEEGENPSMFINLEETSHGDWYISPLYQQVIDWFREIHKLHITVEFDRLKEKDDKEDIETYCFRINEQWSEGKEWYDYNYGFKHMCNKRNIESYYNALNEAIEEAIKLIS